MGMTFSVRVVDNDGDPKEGVRVMANFGILHGHLIELTDQDGWAEFEPAGDYTSVEIFVDGENQGDHSVEDGDTFSFTI
jgi:hypothetical protein